MAGGVFSIVAGGRRHGGAVLGKASNLLTGKRGENKRSLYTRRKEERNALAYSGLGKRMKKALENGQAKEKKKRKELMEGPSQERTSSKA